MRLALLCAAIAILPAVISANTLPKLTTSFIEQLPQRLHFFPNTSSLLVQGGYIGPLNLITSNGSMGVIEGLDREKAISFVKNPFDHRMVIAQSFQGVYRTTDGGIRWGPMDLPFRLSDIQDLSRSSNSYHFHSDAKRAIVIGRSCEANDLGKHCSRQSFYTLDISHETPTWTPLPTELGDCIFAYSSSTFLPSPTLSKDHIFCLRHEHLTGTDANTRQKFRRDPTLVQSSTYFKEDEEGWSDVIPSSSKIFPQINIVGQYLVVLSIEASPSTRRDLFLSNDGYIWRQAKIPNDQLKNRWKPRPLPFSSAIGLYQSVGSKSSLYRSDHDGVAFTEVLEGVDGWNHDTPDEMAGTSGVYIINVPVQSPLATFSGNSLRTLISVDDGANWEAIRATAACQGRDDCSLHIHTKATRLQGRATALFTDVVRLSLAPGYAIGVGCTSDALCDYETSATYLSRDAGASWEIIHATPVMHATGNNGDVIVLVSDSDFVDHVLYSLDGGAHWSTLSLNLGFSIKPKTLTSSPVSQGGRFVLIGSLRSVDRHFPGRAEHVVISVDFSAAFDRNCSETDYETWRVKDSNGEECIMGHRREYRRRKVGALCSSGNLNAEATIVEHCPCNEIDYECDFDYTFNNGTCVPTAAMLASIGICVDSNESFTGASGFRKIAGNTCQDGIALEKEKPIIRECRDLLKGETPPDPLKGWRAPDQAVFAQWPLV